MIQAGELLLSTTKTTLPTRTGAVRSMHSHGCTQSVRNMGFPGGSDGKESACNLGNPGLILGQGDPLEKGTATLSSILTWKIP